jgi:hypothetical protein
MAKVKDSSLSSFDNFGTESFLTATNFFGSPSREMSKPNKQGPFPGET